LDGIGTSVGLDGVLVVVTADHGECFEHGVWFEHSDCLYEGALHVPLIVRGPSGFPAGTRVANLVSLIDVAPTVLRAAGLPLPEGLAGRPLQEGHVAPDRTLLVQHPFYGEETVAGRRAREAVIRSVAGQPRRGILTEAQWVGLVGARWKFLSRNGAEELYPMAPRPDESENRLAAEPEVSADLRRRLAAELSAHPLTHLSPGEVSEELRTALEALGYLE
jgi:arylsulfatase A-like enzyme